MQLRLPWDATARGTAPAVPAAHEVVVDGRAVPVTIARHRRARRYILRVTEDGALRLTVPRGASVIGGLRFAGRQTAWIAGEWRRLASRTTAWRAGTSILFRGARTTVEVEGNVVTCGTERLCLVHAADLRLDVEAHLRSLAVRELPRRTVELAATHGFAVSRVRVGSARSRWGSCAASGAISLNWRLVQMPPAVEDYVICHELAHLRQPNHSVRFWREVAAICPDWRAAERWLRSHGREIL